MLHPFVSDCTVQSSAVVHGEGDGGAGARICGVGADEITMDPILLL